MDRLSIRLSLPLRAARRVQVIFHEGRGVEHDANDVVKVKGKRLQIGAGPDADLRIAEPSIAPLHCSLEMSAGELTLRDRGSERGTLVNGHRCTEPTRLAAGDVIGVGRCTIEIVEIFLEERASKPSARLAHEGEARRAYLRYATELAVRWRSEGRQRHQLIGGRLLHEGGALLDGSSVALDPVVEEWLAASRERHRAREGRLWVVGGALLGLGVAYCVSLGLAPDAEAGALERSALRVGPVGDDAPVGVASNERCSIVKHRVVEGDSWERLSSRYGDPVDTLKRRNRVINGDGPQVDTIVQVCTMAAPPPQMLGAHIVASGETWENLALKHGMDVEKLRSLNREMSGELQVGDRVTIIPRRGGGLLRASPLLPEEAGGATAKGETNNGSLVNGIMLPPSSEYSIRCVAHSYGTSYTVETIMAAIARIRAVNRYEGEIVIGDLSTMTGGGYGPHRSHQNGRDVDIWLPVRGGKYRQSGKCWHCGTEFCRPAPEDVDWDATWQLIKALAAVGTTQPNPVKEIFLDQRLHGELRAAVARDGVLPEDIGLYVQRRRGAPALVTHSEGHMHHIHVRFRCGDDGSACVGP